MAWKGLRVRISSGPLKLQRNFSAKFRQAEIGTEHGRLDKKMHLLLNKATWKRKILKTLPVVMPLL